MKSLLTYKVGDFVAFIIINNKEIRDSEVIIGIIEYFLDDSVYVKHKFGSSYIPLKLLWDASDQLNITLDNIKYLVDVFNNELPPF